MHHHSSAHCHHLKASGSQGILTAFLLNLGFAVIEILGGLFTNSIAIISDALHDLGDSLAIGLAYFFEKISHKQADQYYTYGYARYSILGALITVVILLVGSLLLLSHAIARFSQPREVHSLGMLILAVLGVLINGFAALNITHEQGLQHKAISLHLLEDVLGRVVVLIGSLLIHFFGRTFIDPLLSIGICIFILLHAMKLLKGVLEVFLEKRPQEVCPHDLAKDLQALPGIRDIHHMHVWSLDGQRNYLTLHAVLAAHLSIPQIIALKQQVHHTLKCANIAHSTIEWEREEESCERVPFCS